MWPPTNPTIPENVYVSITSVSLYYNTKKRQYYVVPGQPRTAVRARVETAEPKQPEKE